MELAVPRRKLFVGLTDHDMPPVRARPCTLVAMYMVPPRQLNRRVLSRLPPIPTPIGGEGL